MAMFICVILFIWTEYRRALLDLLLREAAKDSQLTHQDIREEIDTFMFGVFKLYKSNSFISATNLVIDRVMTQFLHQWVGSFTAWLLILSFKYINTPIFINSNDSTYFWE